MLFSGDRLHDAREIVFYEPGLEVLQFSSVRTNRVKAQVRIAPDCRLGEHAVRIRAAGGVSELRTFFVGPFPTIDEKEPNNQPEQAQSIPLNHTVAGVVEVEDADHYLIAAKAGERISVEIEAMRLGRAALDPWIGLQDSKGKWLATADDTALLAQDGCFSVLAPEDGTYVIQVREVSYGGNSQYVYRLHVGNFPRPLAVYPLGGPAGQTLDFTFIGDAAGEFTQSIKLPETPREKFAVFPEQDGPLAPSPHLIRVSPFANALEREPNNSRAEATAAETAPPLALNGIISVDGDEDWFRFFAQKGKAIDVQVYARRLRSPLDSVVEVFDANGKSLGSNDDSAGPDSSMKFTPESDGEYFVRVKDHLLKGGPDFTYRVELTPVEPSLQLSIPQVARNDSQTRQYIVVPKGNRFATLISARRGNFSGDLDLTLADLPEGVSMHAETLSGQVDAMPLVFEAEEDAPVQGKLLDLMARSTNGVEGRFRHEVELVQGPNNSFYYSTTVDRIYVAVTEPAPFAISITEPKVPLVQSGTMNLKIEAKRQEGFDEPITLKMLWTPPGIGALPDVTIPKDKTTAEYRLDSKTDAQTGRWPIAVLASSTAAGGPVWVSSQLVRLQVGDPFLTGKIQTASAEPGQKAKLVCKLEQKIPFEGKATVRLVGLSENIAAPEVEITKDDLEVVFELSIDPKCPPGSQRSLFCNVIVTQEGEEISHNIAPNGVFRVLPPKKEDERKVATAR